MYVLRNDDAKGAVAVEALFGIPIVITIFIFMINASMYYAFNNKLHRYVYVVSDILSTQANLQANDLDSNIEKLINSMSKNDININAQLISYDHEEDEYAEPTPIIQSEEDICNIQENYSLVNPDDVDINQHKYSNNHKYIVLKICLELSKPYIDSLFVKVLFPNTIEQQRIIFYRG